MENTQRIMITAFLMGLLIASVIAFLVIVSVDIKISTKEPLAPELVIRVENGVADTTYIYHEP